MPGTFTYGFDPANSRLDWVRMNLQDTEEDEALLFDEEINYFLQVYMNRPWKVLAEAARMVYFRLARSPISEKAGGYEVRSRSLDHFDDWIAKWDALDGKRTKAPIPQYGGVNVSDIRGNRNDPSIDDKSFYRGAPNTTIRIFDDEWFC